VLPDEQRLFTSWFTFDTERLNDTGPKYSLGDRNQRWLTAQGNFQGNQAQLELTLTSGGQFMSDYSPVANEHYGFLDLEFSDCETATARYEIPDLGISGEIPLKRISNENTPACELMGSAQGIR
jgi:hypothetical protein